MRRKGVIIMETAECPLCHKQCPSGIIHPMVSPSMPTGQEFIIEWRYCEEHDWISNVGWGLNLRGEVRKFEKAILSGETTFDELQEKGKICVSFHASEGCMVTGHPDKHPPHYGEEVIGKIRWQWYLSYKEYRDEKDVPHWSEPTNDKETDQTGYVGEAHRFSIFLVRSYHTTDPKYLGKIAMYDFDPKAKRFNDTEPVQKSLHESMEEVRIEAGKRMG